MKALRRIFHRCKNHLRWGLWIWYSRHANLVVRCEICGTYYMVQKLNDFYRCYKVPLTKGVIDTIFDYPFSRCIIWLPDEEEKGLALEVSR